MRLQETIAAIALLFALAAPVNARETCQSVKVIDGDTIICVNADKKTRIRLYGIDAPEKGQAYGDQARKALAAMLAGKRANYEKMARDRYGRTVALVYRGGKNVNLEMVKSGCVWVYGQFCKKPFCGQWREVEQEARQARRGLWRNRAIPPWEWRKLTGTRHYGARK